DPSLDGRKWTTTVDMAGLFTYSMAAFARRVAEHPDSFCLADRLDAIKFTTAVIGTYLAFRQDMRFSDPGNATWGYYVYPPAFSGLKCNPSSWWSDNKDLRKELRKKCKDYKAAAGKAVSWNQGLLLVKAMAEVASAADSELYRSSPEYAWVSYYATE